MKLMLCLICLVSLLLVSRLGRAEESARPTDEPTPARAETLVPMTPAPPEPHWRSRQLFAGGVFVELLAVPTAVGGSILTAFGAVCASPGGDCFPHDRWMVPTGVLVTISGVAGMAGGIGMMWYGAKHVDPDDEPERPKESRLRFFVRPGLGGVTVGASF